MWNGVEMRGNTKRAKSGGGGFTAYHAANACHCAKCEQAGQSRCADYGTAQQRLIRRKLQVGHCCRSCDTDAVVDSLKWARQWQGRAATHAELEEVEEVEEVEEEEVEKQSSAQEVGKAGGTQDGTSLGHP